ncbi:MAG: CotH kinase family protein, partial [Prevotella sp.]|nr:CotH kinase family protein [Prevotella sp.]
MIINEFMQSNIDGIMDDLNDFPDSWVELYNSGNTAVNLKDYKIGTKKKVANAWQLPDKMVGPGQYVIIYCDKAGEDEGVSALHTNFRLESSKKSSLFLFKGDDTIDKIEDFAAQPAPNIAFGRNTDGSDEWGYQLEPTPGKANTGKTCKAEDILGEPVFSIKGCVMSTKETITLMLTLPDGSPEGTEIRYTLDGSEPTKNSQLYQSQLSFNTNKIVRAKLFCDGKLSPRSTTHSYLFHGRDITLPVISINTDNRYFNDSKIGIYSDNKASDGKKNYEHNWRRPMNIEFFMKDMNASTLNQLIEARVCGGATRGAARKSMAIYANKRFGEKRFNYEFFPDQKPGLKDFKSLMLRNAGNDFDYLYMRDAIIQRNVGSHLDIDWQAWQPAIVYINGQYRGMLNIRERSNEDNIYTNYNGLEDLDMFENWGELKEGTWDNYNAFKVFYNEHGHTMAEFEQWMDCMEFLNLMAANLYYNNVDFPGNNIVMWRPTAEGGRWRWIMKDTDYTMGLYSQCAANYKILEWLYNPNYDSGLNWGANGYDSTRLFRRLMEDADFNREFIDHCAIYMGDFLNEKGTRAVWDPMYNMIKTEYTYHRNLINQWWPNYNDELRNARNWLSQRTNHFYQQLADYYKLGTPTPLVINKDASEEVKTYVNGIEIKDGYFDGKFFEGRKLTVEGKAGEGREVKGWKVMKDGSTTQVDGSIYTFD